MNVPAAPIRRILVVATRQIGDVLLTTPLIREARRLWPEATIDVLGFAGTLGMLEGNPDVADLLEAPASGGLRASLAFVRRHRLWRQYDLALVTQHSDRAHLFGFVAAPLRAGLVGADGRHSWWKRLLLAHAVTIAGDRGQVHVAREKLSLLDPWRASGDAASPSATLDATAPTVVAPAPAPLPAAVEAVLVPSPVVVQAPSMWRYKAWPLASFRELVAALLADGHQVVLTGGSAEEDRRAVASLATLAAPPRLLDVAGQLDFAQMTTLLRRAALYIGPDTSITHLAAASGVPVIALFGPTNPVRWGPITESAVPPFAMRSLEPQRRGRVILMQGGQVCVPCGRAGCEDHRHSRSDCLESISPTAVIAEARAVLGRVAATVAAA